MNITTLLEIVSFLKGTLHTNIYPVPFQQVTSPNNCSAIYQQSQTTAFNFINVDLPRSWKSSIYWLL